MEGGWIDEPTGTVGSPDAMGWTTASPPVWGAAYRFAATAYLLASFVYMRFWLGRLPMITFTSQNFLLLTAAFTMLSAGTVATCAAAASTASPPSPPTRCAYVVKHLQQFSCDLFALALANALFLDVVWWLILRPMDLPGTWRDYWNWMPHGPINLALCLGECCLNRCQAAAYVLYVGVAYLMCYFLFGVLYFLTRGRWIYFFLDIRKPLDCLLLLITLLWYVVCHRLVRALQHLRGRFYGDAPPLSR